LFRSTKLIILQTKTAITQRGDGCFLKCDSGQFYVIDIPRAAAMQVTREVEASFTKNPQNSSGAVVFTPYWAGMVFLGASFQFYNRLRCDHAEAPWIVGVYDHNQNIFKKQYVKTIIF